MVAHLTFYVNIKNALDTVMHTFNRVLRRFYTNSYLYYIISCYLTVYLYFRLSSRQASNRSIPIYFPLMFLNVRYSQHVSTVSLLYASRGNCSKVIIFLRIFSTPLLCVLPCFLQHGFLDHVSCFLFNNHFHNSFYRAIFSFNNSILFLVYRLVVF